MKELERRLPFPGNDDNYGDGCGCKCAAHDYRCDHHCTSTAQSRLSTTVRDHIQQIII